jgi:hypothetical protein
MRRLMPIAWVVVFAACRSGDDRADDCAELGRLYESHMADICKPDSGYATTSGFCSTCARAHLFSYKRSSEGVCQCAPLFLQGDSCAGDVDDSKLLAAIAAADDECNSYTLERIDAGADDGAPSEDAADVGSADAPAETAVEDSSSSDSATDAAVDVNDGETTPP